MIVGGAGFTLSTSEVVDKLNEIAMKTPNAALRALNEIAEGVSAVSKSRTPVDTGTLRGSHIVRTELEGGEFATATIEVGGPAAPYALFVHEGLFQGGGRSGGSVASHSRKGKAGKKKGVGGPKFLESAVNEVTPSLAGLIAGALGDI